MGRKPVSAGKSAKRPCGLARRLLAMIYDLVIIIGLWLIAAAIASPLDSGNQQALHDPWFTAYLAAVWFVYLAYCWTHGGMTIGMRAWRLELVADEGYSVNWQRAFLRFFGSLVSALAFGAGFAWSIWDPRRRCWQDIISHTAIYYSD